MLRGALVAKFVEASGPSGKAAARDRRFISRWLAFCRRSGIRKFWPIGSVAFKEFISSEASSSKGAKGGLSVPHSLKLAAVHARDHFCLPVELDAAVLFNSIRPYKGDSDAATAPSLHCLSSWEREAVHHTSPAVRHACSVATVCTWLSLRSIHLVRASVLATSNDDDIRLNISRDKDGSSNMWAGCDARGLLGPFGFWPSLMEASLRLGFLVRFIDFDIASGEISSATVSDARATSASVERLFALAFLAAGVPRKLQLTVKFTGHSPRHLLPCFAEVLMWSAALRDELGRWATGAANAKKVKCGPRYTVQANQALQIFLRRTLCSVMADVYPILDVSSGPEAAVPDFHAISGLEEVTSSPCFGPQGPGFIPGFGRAGP